MFDSISEVFIIQLNIAKFDLNFVRVRACEERIYEISIINIFRFGANYFYPQIINSRKNNFLLD